MRKLLSVATAAQAERLRKELFRAGISVTVRDTALLQVLRGRENLPELWVLDESDYLPAARICHSLTREGALKEVRQPAVLVVSEPTDSTAW